MPLNRLPIRIRGDALADEIKGVETYGPTKYLPHYFYVGSLARLFLCGVS